MCSMALVPRNGMLPCAMRPCVVTSNQYTPRWPMQMRSTLSGSGMITKSVRAAAMRPCSQSQPTPAKPPLSSSTVPLISTLPRRAIAGAPHRFGGVDRRGDARLHVARAAAVDAAVAHDARKRIDGPPFAGGDDVEVAVEMNERARLRAASRGRRHSRADACACARAGRPARRNRPRTRTLRAARRSTRAQSS